MRQSCHSACRSGLSIPLFCDTSHDKTAQMNRLAHIALVVHDYDEAIDFYTKKLDFVLVEDTRLTVDKRWVVVSPSGSNECSLLLAKAVGEKQLASVGNQTGGRVFLFLHTDNFQRDYKKISERGVRFVRPPSTEPYGKVAVFEDLYGNLWDLIQPNTEPRPT